VLRRGSLRGVTRPSSPIYGIGRGESRTFPRSAVKCYILSGVGCVGLSVFFQRCACSAQRSAKVSGGGERKPSPFTRWFWG
jgi:hypothetical protein